jgi:hypothetical protein
MQLYWQANPNELFTPKKIRTLNHDENATKTNRSLHTNWVILGLHGWLVPMNRVSFLVLTNSVSKHILL